MSFDLFEIFDTLIHVLLRYFLNVLKIMQQNFFSLLLAIGLLVGLVYLIQVVRLLCEKSLRIGNCVVQIEVFAIFVGFEIQLVKKFHETLIELRKLNIAWASFDLPLQNSNCAVLFS